VNEHPLILLVDDDVDCLEINRLSLEAQGWRVLTAFGPQEALRKIEQEVPAVVLTDLMMDTLNAGFGFAKLLRSDPRTAGVKIAILTAVGARLGFDFRPKSPQDLEAMGADAFLEKPADPERLVKTVSILLESTKTAVAP
jgi:chemosensory pili system protein ChpA (sensor histidine kinase/response regulator)